MYIKKQKTGRKELLRSSVFGAHWCFTSAVRAGRKQPIFCSSATSWDGYLVMVVTDGQSMLIFLSDLNNMLLVCKGRKRRN